MRMRHDYTDDEIDAILEIADAVQSEISTAHDRVNSMKSHARYSWGGDVPADVAVAQLKKLLPALKAFNGRTR